MTPIRENAQIRDCGKCICGTMLRAAAGTPPAACLGGSSMYKKILVAYDGSDAGQKALLDCKELAMWSQSELHLVAVMPSPGWNLQK